MKIGILILTIIFPFGLFGQVINHFSNPDSRWTVANTYPNANSENPSFVETQTRVYGFQGDTLINAEVWLKLFSTSDTLFNTNLSFESYILSEEDYVLSADNDLEVDTLYKYDLNVGDSVIFDFGFLVESIAVLNIDTIFINDQEYRRFHFDEPSVNAFSVFNEIWIEGIGSIHGPLFPNVPGMFSTEIPSGLDLLCSTSNGSDLWNHPNFEGCFINNILSTSTQESNVAKVYPNPFENIIHIELVTEGVKELRICDTLGRFVLGESIQGTNFTLNTEVLKEGIYFLQILANNHVTSVKLIKR